MNRTIPAIEADEIEILGFIALVLGLSWLQFLPSLFQGLLDMELPGSVELVLVILFVFSPLIAALALVVRRTSPKEAVTFLRNRLRWRVSFSWYLVVLLLLPLLGAGALAVFVLAGESLQVDGVQSLFLVVQVFTIGIVANLIENYGWRGYLQEGLQSIHSAFVASLVVGVVWGLWHAPLLLVDDGQLSAIPFVWYMLLIIGLAVIFGWVYNETGGSVLLVTLMHCAFNASIGLVFFSLIQAGGDVSLFTTLSAVVIWIAVGGILLWTNVETLTRVPRPTS